MNSKMNTKKTLLASMVGLFAAAGGASSAMAQGDEAATAQGRIDEIIVTANKREQSLQDASMSISVLTSDDIHRKSLVGMSDYLATIPGVSQADLGVGRNRTTMRGIASGVGDETTVGVFLGEIPLTQLGGGISTDIKLVDIERIEILRGPQGTLYGSGTMGGTIRNIPKEPNLEEFEAEFQVGLSQTDDASGVNNKTTGVINIPLLENQLALRVAAYRFDSQGYTDLVGGSDPTAVADFGATFFSGILLDKTDQGDTEYTGMRASALWQPTEKLALTLTHVIQDLQQTGFNEAIFEKDGYKDVAFDLNGKFGGNEGLTDDADLSNLVIEYDMGWASLLSTSTWSESVSGNTDDAGRFTGAPLARMGSTDRDGFVQEFRLTSQLEGPFQFVGGLYYEDLEQITQGSIVWSGDPAQFSQFTQFFGADPSDVLQLHNEHHLEQKAMFGEVSYAVTDQLKLTLGGRWFDYDRKRVIDNTGFFGSPPTDEENDETDTLGKVNLTYSLSDETLIYAQWAQGFRVAQAVVIPPKGLCDADNDGILDGTNTPISTDDLSADSLDSYELGSKVGLLDKRLVLSAAIYRIEWDGIPITVRGSCGFGTSLNAGGALSQGVELETSYSLSNSLRVDFSVAYNDAELDTDASGLGSKGDRLPLSPRSNASLGLEYTFELAGYDSFFYANYAYVGGYYENLQETGIEMGDYDKLSLRAGITINQLDIELYGTNLTESNEFVGSTGPFGGYRISPRQIGLDFHYKF